MFCTKIYYFFGMYVFCGGVANPNNSELFPDPASILKKQYLPLPGTSFNILYCITRKHFGVL